MLRSKQQPGGRPGYNFASTVPREFPRGRIRENMRSWHGLGRLLSRRLERVLDTLITLVATQIETAITMRSCYSSKVSMLAQAESSFAARMAAHVPESLTAKEGVGFLQSLLYSCRFLSCCYRLILFSFVLKHLACIYRRLEGAQLTCPVSQLLISSCKKSRDVFNKCCSCCTTTRTSLVSSTKTSYVLSSTLCESVPHHMWCISYQALILIFVPIQKQKSKLLSSVSLSPLETFLLR